MEIKNAFAIEVDFDGDIRSEAAGFHIFAGDDARQETRETLKTALYDMGKRMAQKGWEAVVTIGITDYLVSKVLESNELLDEIICNGGFSHGNWEINIRCTEEWYK
jgi:hypothetical protein